MKKLIISLICFLAVLGLSVYEIVLTSDTYANLERLTAAAESAAELCTEYKQSVERQRESDKRESADTKSEYEAAESRAKDSIDEVEKFWQKRKIGAMFFGNHAVTKSVDERVATLKAQANCGQWEDATASAAALRTYFKDLKDDTHPSPSNLF